MLCAKFGLYYWPSGSVKEDENVKSLQTLTQDMRSENLTSFQFRLQDHEAVLVFKPKFVHRLKFKILKRQTILRFA